MKIETTTVTQAIRITEIPGLDPINVIFQDTAPGQGRVFVECYGNAWASWWGSMGDRTVRQFVASSHVGYLMNNLVWGRMAKNTRKDGAYLERICTALIAALNGEAEEGEAKHSVDPTMERLLLDSALQDEKARGNALEDGIREIYALRGEDAVIAAICRKLIP